MLYNPNWEQKTTDAFSLQSLIAWLEKQPAHLTYEYAFPKTCMLAQYFEASGFTNVNMLILGFEHGLNQEKKLPLGWNAIAQCHPRTFGGALERARLQST